MNQKHQGFTLIEILLVVGLMTIIMGLTLPISASLIQQNNSENAQESFSTALRTAQTYSRNNHHDDNWSVKINTSEVVIFKGNDYINRDQSYDEKFPISQSVTKSGVTDISFEKSTGQPDISGVTTFSSGVFSETVSINSIGTVSY
jgi:prepilin-type N-terminal cleavage/methylation domain-containing protein